MEKNTNPAGGVIARLEEDECDEAGMFMGTARVVPMVVVAPIIERLEARVAALEAERAGGKLMAFLSPDKTQFFIPEMEGKEVNHAPYRAHWMTGWLPLYAGPLHSQSAVVLELVRRLRSAESRLHEVATACATAEQERDAWRNAVVDQLDVMHITCARHKDDPAFAVHDCMAYSVNLALDPAISEQAQALVDAGREAARAEREGQKPAFWYRPHSDGLGYDGPINDSQIEAVRRNSGAWVPLYAGPLPSQSASALVGLRGCNSRHGGAREPDPCIYRMRTTDPGCTGCADRGEDQRAEAGG